MLAALFYLTTFFSCLKEPCEGKICLNDGVCMDGTCDCPDQFTGKDCSQQSTPDFIRLNSIQVTRFPATNAGVSWDPTDGPDIFFRLHSDEHPLAQPLVLFENADASTDYYFFINIIDFHHVKSVHRIQLFDYDGIGANHDLLGEISFTPYHDTNGFPQMVVIDEGGPIAFTLTYEYHFTKD